MGKLIDVMKREFLGWKKWQVIWIIFANVIILGVSLYLGDTIIGILASLAGVTCVILWGWAGYRITFSEPSIFCGENAKKERDFCCM